MEETIWYEDPKGFIDSAHYDKFFPSSKAPLEAQLNAFMRFTLYFTVIVLVVTHNFRVLYFLGFVALLTYVMYQAYHRDRMERRRLMERMNLGYDARTQGACVKPTVDNPYMNILATDYRDNPHRQVACDILDPDVTRDADDKFSSNLYRDVSDVFNRHASDRSYYSVPIQSIPNDQEAFSRWLYQSPPTCKESGLACWNGPTPHNAKCS